MLTPDIMSPTASQWRSPSRCVAMTTLPVRQPVVGVRHLALPWHCHHTRSPFSLAMAKYEDTEMSVCNYLHCHGNLLLHSTIRHTQTKSLQHFAVFHGSPFNIFPPRTRNFSSLKSGEPFSRDNRELRCCGLLSQHACVTTSLLSTNEMLLLFSWHKVHWNILQYYGPSFLDFYLAVIHIEDHKRKCLDCLSLPTPLHSKSCNWVCWRRSWTAVHSHWFGQYPQGYNRSYWNRSSCPDQQHPWSLHQQYCHKTKHDGNISKPCITNALGSRAVQKCEKPQWALLETKNAKALPGEQGILGNIRVAVVGSSLLWRGRGVWGFWPGWWVWLHHLWADWVLKCHVGSCLNGVARGGRSNYQYYITDTDNFLYVSSILEQPGSSLSYPRPILQCWTGVREWSTHEL